MKILRKAKSAIKKQSVTITGLIVIVIGLLLEHSKINIAPDKIQTTIEVLIQLSGVIIAWIGRVKAGGINIFGRKLD